MHSRSFYINTVLRWLLVVCRFQHIAAVDSDLRHAFLAIAALLRVAALKYETSS